MARITTNHREERGTLSEEQWHDLMRSLIEDTDEPLDEESGNTYLQEVAGRDHAKSSKQGPSSPG
jgi:hypothetical protein